MRHRVHPPRRRPRARLRKPPAPRARAPPGLRHAFPPRVTARAPLAAPRIHPPETRERTGIYISKTAVCGLLLGFREGAGLLIARARQPEPTCQAHTPGLSTHSTQALAPPPLPLPVPNPPAPLSSPARPAAAAAVAAAAAAVGWAVCPGGPSSLGPAAADASGSEAAGGSSGASGAGSGAGGIAAQAKATAWRVADGQEDLVLRTHKRCHNHTQLTPRAHLYVGRCGVASIAVGVSRQRQEVGLDDGPRGQGNSAAHNLLYNLSTFLILLPFMPL